MEFESGAGTVAVEAEMYHCAAHSVLAFSRHFRVIACVAYAAEREGTPRENLSNADVESHIAAAIVVHGKSLEVLRTIHHSERMMTV